MIVSILNPAWWHRNTIYDKYLIYTQDIHWQSWTGKLKHICHSIVVLVHSFIRTIIITEGNCNDLLHYYGCHLLSRYICTVRLGLCCCAIASFGYILYHFQFNFIMITSDFTPIILQGANWNYGGGRKALGGNRDQKLKRTEVKRN